VTEPMDAVLRCPKCYAGMASFQRGDVVIDHCGGCRGVFLDEGDLARLIDTASSPLSNVTPNGYPKQIYEGRHRRD
jgi:Zn-finger nucleic acid-binding protein